MSNHESLKAFKVIRDPLSPNYIGYSFSVNDQREIDYKDGSHHGKPGVVPTTTAPQTPSKPMRGNQIAILETITKGIRT